MWQIKKRILSELVRGRSQRGPSLNMYIAELKNHLCLSVNVADHKEISV